jgi:hypothetical protein
LFSKYAAYSQNHSKAQNGVVQARVMVRLRMAQESGRFLRIRTLMVCAYLMLAFYSIVGDRRNYLRH